MHLKTMLSGLFLLSAHIAAAQQQEPIQTDRPDQTESVAITPKGFLQGEFGFSREQVGPHSNDESYPSVLLKYGLSERFEMRFIAEIVSENSDVKLRGVLPFTVGFKVKLCEEKGIRPKTSFIGHLTIPKVASKKLRSTYYAPAFRFTMQHTLSDKISLGYNLGAEWDGETPEPAFIYTLTTGFALTEKLGAYAEIYGFAPQLHPADHRADGGVTYLLSNNVQIDFSAGLGLTPNAPDYFLAAGFSFRLNTRGKK